MTDRPSVLVDTNVLFDVLYDDPVWAEWSIIHLEDASLGTLAISDVIYAELSVRFPTIEELDAAIMDVRLTLAPMPREALFMAGQAFRRYRARGGTRTSPLPDFFIGAQAAVMGIPLLTRDAQRYRSYFPTLVLIAP